MKNVSKMTEKYGKLTRATVKENVVFHELPDTMEQQKEKQKKNIKQLIKQYNSISGDDQIGSKMHNGSIELSKEFRTGTKKLFDGNIASAIPILHNLIMIKNRFGSSSMKKEDAPAITTASIGSGATYAPKIGPMVSRFAEFPEDRYSQSFMKKMKSKLNEAEEKNTIGYNKLIRIFDDINSDADLKEFKSEIDKKGSEFNKYWKSMTAKEKAFLSTLIIGKADYFADDRVPELPLHWHVLKHYKDKLNEADEGKHVITSTYETWDEESLEAGETDDKGWLDEEGESMEIEPEYDDEDETVITKTVSYLKKKGAIHPSSSHGARWYSTEGDTNYRSGEQTIESYHLNGYTEKELDEIGKLMK